jgi:3-hydroxyacyl-[acyl-carrier-protein] dehydratase
MTTPPGGPLALTISAEHPCLPGHFPGNPVVPAVIILDAVIAALRAAYPAQSFRGVRKIKFLRPLAAEQTFLLEYAQPKQDSLRFKCHLQDSGELLVEGNLLLGNVAPAESPVA